ncbi:hypothetical protein BD309DRAFT_331018 [Dichomitus squalens]|uniref:Uncharacterized protein n=1 Tax=Dichomitus squalens TaxID=114155 RepID=A0A4Q9PHS1_9APHY|nr:hypothetical protein BD309DRAFT_331018 [Dichomitus squalens]TBU53487.1 hypothetical protein BD310DRAFT_156210 [Dichomitus squalens]
MPPRDGRIKFQHAEVSMATITCTPTILIVVLSCYNLRDRSCVCVIATETRAPRRDRPSRIHYRRKLPCWALPGAFAGIEHLELRDR